MKIRKKKSEKDKRQPSFSVVGDDVAKSNMIIFIRDDKKKL